MGEETKGDKTSMDLSLAERHKPLLAIFQSSWLAYIVTLFLPIQIYQSI